MKDVCTEVSCEFFQAYKWCKVPSCPRKKRRWDTCGLTENSVLVDSGARGERKDEVEIDIDENWYSDEYRRIGEDEKDEVEE